MKQIKSFLKSLYQVIMKPELRILPGNLAFFLVLSIIPIITLIGFIASYFSISIDSLVTFLSTTLPKEISSVLLPFIQGKGIDGNIVFYMITGFIVASNGAHSIILTSNILYDIPHSEFLKRRIKALFLTILLVSLFFFVVVFLAFGNVILKFIMDLEAFNSISESFYYFFVFLKWPIAFFCIFFLIKMIYTMAPDERIPSHYVNKGAMFTTLAWSLVTACYSYYVAHFTNYDIFYGSLSGIIILMMWIYILSYILVIGIAINTEVYKNENKNT